MAEDGKVKNGVTIAPCTCKSEFQDATYGKGMRVKNNGRGLVRCTVCGVSDKDKMR
jgi:hypothetical protein